MAYYGLLVADLWPVLGPISGSLYGLLWTFMWAILWAYHMLHLTLRVMGVIT